MAMRPRKATPERRRNAENFLTSHIRLATLIKIRLIARAAKARNELATTRSSLESMTADLSLHAVLAGNPAISCALGLRRPRPEALRPRLATGLPLCRPTVD